MFPVDLDAQLAQFGGQQLADASRTGGKKDAVGRLSGVVHACLGAVEHDEILRSHGLQARPMMR